MLTFKIAETIQDYIDAWSIVYNQYLQLKLIAPNPTRIWTFPEYLCEKSFTLSTYEHGKITATMSGVWGDKIPLDDYYSEELNNLRNHYGTLMEIGLFAKARKDVPQFHVTQMLDIFFGIVRHSNKMLQTVGGVHPDAGKIYVEKLGYSIIGKDKKYTILHDAPVRLLYKDLAIYQNLSDVKTEQFPKYENRLVLNQDLVLSEPKLNFFYNKLFVNQ